MNPRNLSRRAMALAALLSIGLTPSCAAVFPELDTRVDAAPKSGELDPPPPDDRMHLRVVSGKVPARTRDGREWDQVLGSLPDPYVKVLVNGTEIYKTDPQSDTLEPRWENKRAGNYRIALGDRVELQLWDSNPLSDQPIGKRQFLLGREDLGSERSFELSGDARVELELTPARAVWGVGISYELRNGGARITRVLDQSPAFRAGVVAGDMVRKMDGKDIGSLSSDEIRSRFGSIPTTGLALVLQRADGKVVEFSAKAGPIYPLWSDYRLLPVKPE